MGLWNLYLGLYMSGKGYVRPIPNLYLNLSDIGPGVLGGVSMSVAGG